MSQIVKGCRAILPAGTVTWGGSGASDSIDATYPIAVTVVDTDYDILGTPTATIETIWRERYRCYVSELKFLSMPKPPSLSEIMKKSVK